MPASVTCLVDARATVGESPVWDAATDSLYWVDIIAGKLSRITLGADLTGRAVQSWTVPAAIGSLGLCPDGRLLVALPYGVHYFDPATETLPLLVDPEPGMDTNRLNDGKMGPDGAFWVGSMDDRPTGKQPIAALYRVTPDGKAEKKIDQVTVSNGLAWSADGKSLFHSDSRGIWLDRWDFDAATGAISNRTRIATPDEATGRPDGGACDAEGFYWSCGVSAGRLNRFAPDGSIVETIALPVPAPTMPCFGGRDLKTLFFTSLRAGLSPEKLEAAPLSGGLFMMQMPVAGAPIARFGEPLRF
ncbi:SMP-30/gluconolactonase/LRE family protein [Elstera sp.]|jgi:sugar lactone lactonase YvrE|uniref:SMP-30/gluconolactonase/LRE family protein n=1 Tax=Elstera sp. TaxID=1916664 RepID=UPI0037BFD7D8